MKDRILMITMLKDVMTMLESELQEYENNYLRATLNYVGCAINQLEICKRVEDSIRDVK